MVEFSDSMGQKIQCASTHQSKTAERFRCALDINYTVRRCWLSFFSRTSRAVICVYFVFFSYCIYVVLLSAQWGGPNWIDAQSLGPLFLQCFDTVGWVF